MSTMTPDGCSAKIAYDPDLDRFRDGILRLKGGADFWGRDPKQIRPAFGKSLQVFLDVCCEQGIKPQRIGIELMLPKDQ